MVTDAGVFEVSDRNFKDYVGDEDIHDGEIASLIHDGNRVVVSIRSGGWKRKHGDLFKIVFCNVSMVKKTNLIGRMLYALSVSKGDGITRHFYFAAEDDEPCLEIHAEAIAIEEA
jgi:hypothetical protein